MSLVPVQPYDDRLPARSPFAARTSSVACQFPRLPHGAGATASSILRCSQSAKRTQFFSLHRRIPCTKLLVTMTMSGVKEPGHSLNWAQCLPKMVLIGAFIKAAFPAFQVFPFHGDSASIAIEFAHDVSPKLETCLFGSKFACPFGPR